MFALSLVGRDTMPNLVRLVHATRTTATCTHRIWTQKNPFIPFRVPLRIMNEDRFQFLQFRQLCQFRFLQFGILGHTLASSFMLHNLSWIPFTPAIARINELLDFKVEPRAVNLGLTHRILFDAGHFIFIHTAVLFARHDRKLNRNALSVLNSNRKQIQIVIVLVVDCVDHITITFIFICVAGVRSLIRIAGFVSVFRRIVRSGISSRTVGHRVVGIHIIRCSIVFCCCCCWYVRQIRYVCRRRRSFIRRWRIITIIIICRCCFVLLSRIRIILGSLSFRFIHILLSRHRYCDVLLTRCRTRRRRRVCCSQLITAIVFGGLLALTFHFRNGIQQRVHSWRSMITSS
mmetsp:Transcript_55432/g.92134  ORF Transcript_55432/g.92134 Transcript_55432/m.92134 type:complete len:346 (-) Transcript_55432:59-1096(-)